LVAWKGRKLSQYEPFVEDVTGLIVITENNVPRTFSGDPAMVMARVKPVAIKYEIFVNPFATNAVKTAQIHSW
jgi:hypothetical protein